jgi:hypothetical protein
MLGFSQDELLRLAQRGRVLLLLDGWNELNPAARKRLRVELDQIRHDSPYVRIVATTRRQMLDVPTSGPRIAIEPLSEDQEMAIARAQFGAAGEKIVDDAWRTAGVRDRFGHSTHKRRFKVALVERFGKRAYLTEAGEKLIEHARNLLEEDSRFTYAPLERRPCRSLTQCCRRPLSYASFRPNNPP